MKIARVCKAKTLYFESLVFPSILTKLLRVWSISTIHDRIDMRAWEQTISKKETICDVAVQASFGSSSTGVNRIDGYKMRADDMLQVSGN